MSPNIWINIELELTDLFSIRAMFKYFLFNVMPFWRGSEGCGGVGWGVPVQLDLCWWRPGSTK